MTDSHKIEEQHHTHAIMQPKIGSLIMDLPLGMFNFNMEGARGLLVSMNLFAGSNQFKMAWYTAMALFHTVLFYCNNLSTAKSNVHMFLLVGLTACPSGYSLVYRHCFKITRSSERATALSRCQSSDGTLATITSSAENEAVKNFVTSQTTSSVWIGYKRTSTGSSTFAWADGSTSTYTNWNSGEPNSVNEDSVELNQSGGWNDVPGTISPRPGLCMIDKTGKLVVMSLNVVFTLIRPET
jgi:hypothetical protein